MFMQDDRPKVYVCGSMDTRRWLPLGHGRRKDARCWCDASVARVAPRRDTPGRTRAREARAQWAGPQQALPECDRLLLGAFYLVSLFAEYCERPVIAQQAIHRLHRKGGTITRERVLDC